MLRMLGIGDPVRAILIDAGLTPAEIKTTWRDVTADRSRGASKIRSFQAVFLKRICEIRGVELGKANTIKIDSTTALLALRLDDVRESAGVTT